MGIILLDDDEKLKIKKLYNYTKNEKSKIFDEFNNAIKRVSKRNTYTFHLISIQQTNTISIRQEPTQEPYKKELDSMLRNIKEYNATNSDYVKKDSYNNIKKILDSTNIDKLRESYPKDLKKILDLMQSHETKVKQEAERKLKRQQGFSK